MLFEKHRFAFFTNVLSLPFISKKFVFLAYWMKKFVVVCVKGVLFQVILIAASARKIALLQ